MFNFTRVSHLRIHHTYAYNISSFKLKLIIRHYNMSNSANIVSKSKKTHTMTCTLNYKSHLRNYYYRKSIIYIPTSRFIYHILELNILIVHDMDIFKGFIMQRYPYVPSRYVMRHGQSTYLRQRVKASNTQLHRLNWLISVIIPFQQYSAQYLQIP